MEKSSSVPPRFPTINIEEELNYAMKTNRNLTTILNGHLSLEQTIEASCRKKLVDPSEIFEDTNFGFALKLKLLKALFGSEIDTSIYTACHKLNKLRNELAHNLGSPKVRKLQAELLTLALPTMKGQTYADVEAFESDLLAELTFYKIHAIIRGILKISFADEMDKYAAEMTEWRDALK